MVIVAQAPDGQKIKWKQALLRGFFLQCAYEANYFRRREQAEKKPGKALFANAAQASCSAPRISKSLRIPWGVAQLACLS